MPKALCWTGLVIAILVLVLFLSDLIFGFVAVSIAPFQGMSLMLDVIFVLSAAALGYLSWTTLKEQDKR